MDHVLPNPWMILPFAALLAMIALGPLFFPKWWEKHYPKVSFGLAAAMILYYLAGLRTPEPLLEKMHEYVSFIALIGSLFIVSGGIHINVKGEATPMVNVVFLLVGAVLANFLGTTGASMVLIRPWLRMNKYRVTAHHVVFFIFIVSNVGGCLTPIGDPPLFLGYLKGIPFWWVAEHCWPMWAAGVGVLLAMFYAVDSANFRRAPKRVRVEQTRQEQWRFDGLGNVLFLAVILGAVFLEKPAFLREALMIGAAAASYFTTKKSVHESNDFNFHPILEVAILFAGIFATMIPALQWLEAGAHRFNHAGAAFFYAGTGTLSSVLDNAPTYLSFLAMMLGAFVNPDVVQRVTELLQSGGGDWAAMTGPHAEEIKRTFVILTRYHPEYLAAKTATPHQIGICYLLGNPSFTLYIVAISVGSVFFGAATYIGNGPNFMVKSIAEHAKINTPGFLGYIFRFTLPFLLPMLLVVWLLFFRS